MHEDRAVVDVHVQFQLSLFSNSTYLDRFTFVLGGKQYRAVAVLICLGVCFILGTT